MVQQPTPEPITYRGHTISHSGNHRLVCPYFVDELRRPCRDHAHGRELIDASLERQQQPREIGPSIVGYLPDGRLLLSASEHRNRSERMRGVWQRRRLGLQ
jgi:hypothetical protein